MNTFLREQRLYNNGLNRTFKDAAQVSKNLLGVQSQLHYYAMIAIFNRTKNQTIKKIANNENILKGWGQRTTHHLYNKEDFATINQNFSGASLWPLAHINNPNEVINTIKEFTDNRDTFTKEDLMNLFPSSLHTTLNVWSALIILGCTQGLMYVEVMEDNTKRYRSSKDISSESKDLSYIIKQYFTYYGPATIQDFSHWSGLPQKDFIKNFNTIKDDLICTEEVYFSTFKPTKKRISYPIMLGKFDPLLVSYKDKSWILGEHDSSIIWRKAAHVEGVIIDKTGLIATWHYTIKGKQIIFNIKPILNLDISFLTSKFNEIREFMNKDTMSLKIEDPY